MAPRKRACSLSLFFRDRVHQPRGLRRGGDVLRGGSCEVRARPGLLPDTWLPDESPRRRRLRVVADRGHLRARDLLLLGQRQMQRSVCVGCRPGHLQRDTLLPVVGLYGNTEGMPHLFIRSMSHFTSRLLRRSRKLIQTVPPGDPATEDRAP